MAEASPPSGIVNLFDALYDRFIARDVFAKAGPGLLLLVTAVFSAAPDKQVLTELRFSSAWIWVAIFVVAWIAGFIIQGIGWCSCLIRYFPSKTNGEKNQRQDYERKRRDLLSIGMAAEIRQVERLRLVKEACGNASVVMFLSVVLVLIFYAIQCLRNLHNAPLYVLVDKMSWSFWTAIVFLVIGAFSLLAVHKDHVVAEWKLMEYIVGRGRVEIDIVAFRDGVKEEMDVLLEHVEVVNYELDARGIYARPSTCSPVVKPKRPLDIPVLVKDAIEHTLLKPDARPIEIENLCDQAGEQGFFGVCVQPLYVELVEKCKISRHYSFSVISVVGFPHGANTTAAKELEGKTAIRNGADELDMVMPIGLLKAKEYRAVYDDIRRVVEVAVEKPVKVIIETALLSFAEKVAASLIVARAGAAFVKTSTGFAGGGATVDDVTLLRRVVPQNVGVKASGGIRDLKTAIAMIEAGADRLGCSASLDIMIEASRYTLGKRKNGEGQS